MLASNKKFWPEIIILKKSQSPKVTSEKMPLITKHGWMAFSQIDAAQK